MLAPGALLGATAPDWLEWLITPVRNVRHRTVTHYLVLWIAAVLFFFLVWDFRHLGERSASAACSTSSPTP